MPQRKQLIQFMGAMANDNRFAILLALQEKPLNVSELCEILGLEQSCVSHSLKRLVKENLIEAKADGAFRIYSIQSELVLSFLDGLLDFCDQRATDEESLMSVERQKREEIATLLREHDSVLSGILDHAPITMSVIDKEGFYLVVKGEMVRMFGRNVEDLVGKNVFDLYRRDSYVGDNITRALQGEDTRWTIEAAGYTFETFSLPMRNAAGEVDRVLSISVNATEWLRQKKPGMELADLQYLLDEVPGARLLVGRNESVIWANRFAREMLPTVAVGKKLFDCFPSGRREGLETVLRDVLDAGEKRELELSVLESGTPGDRYLLRMAPVWQHSHVYAAALFFLPKPAGV